MTNHDTPEAIAITDEVARELLEAEKLKAINAKLIEALQYLLEREWQDDDFDDTLINARDKARAIIAKATKEQA